MAVTGLEKYSMALRLQRAQETALTLGRLCHAQNQALARQREELEDLRAEVAEIRALIEQFRELEKKTAR
jgi:hypothetical protein